MGKVVPFGGNGSMTAPAALAAALQNLSRATAPSGMFLRMGKDGEWIAGVELEPIADGAEFAINPTGFGHGWIAWGDNSNRLGESFVPLTEEPPTPEPLTEHSERGWEEQMGMHLRELDGQVDMVFRTASVGGKRAVGALAKEVGLRMAAGAADCVPIVTLASDSYKHTKYGKIYVPEFVIERWVTVEAVTAQEHKAAPKAAPAKAQKPAPKVKPRTRR
jgi:hypothetical protein